MKVNIRFVVIGSMSFLCTLSFLTCFFWPAVSYRVGQLGKVLKHSHFSRQKAAQFTANQTETRYLINFSGISSDRKNKKPEKFYPAFCAAFKEDLEQEAGYALPPVSIETSGEGKNFEVTISAEYPEAGPQQLKVQLYGMTDELQAQMAAQKAAEVFLGMLERSRPQPNIRIAFYQERLPILAGVLLFGRHFSA